MRVVGVGAICDFDPNEQPVGFGSIANPERTTGLNCGHSSGPEHKLTNYQKHFSVGEFVDLENGRRVILHNDRGYSVGSQVTFVSGENLQTNYLATKELSTNDSATDDSAANDSATDDSATDDTESLDYVPVGLEANNLNDNARKIYETVE